MTETNGRDDSDLARTDPSTLEDVLIDRARQMVPNLLERGALGEELRRLPEETMREAEQAGFFQAMVPKRFGGFGLGIRVLSEVGRVLAQGDASSAWTICFLMEHNWMAAHWPIEGQELLYAERPFITAAAPLFPGGTAERVPGGYRVTGTFRYSSGIQNSDYCLITAIAKEQGENIPYTFIVERDKITVHDDWFMSGMAATGSSTVSTENLFVPDHFSLETELLHSGTGHPGAAHEEPIYRHPLLQGIGAMCTGITLGCAQGALELGRERLMMPRPAPFGPRVDRELPRARWSAAAQKIRAAEALYHPAVARVIEKGDAGEPWSLEEHGRLDLDFNTVVHLCKDAVREVLDGSSSSAFQLSNPLQRFLRDIEVLANHGGADRDIVLERGSRWSLGLGRSPHDPFAPRSTPRIPSTVGSSR
jgi:3-hydroxy-9,10-secoandrosta-1,3,5(10)-triene-9,17-dione monooxygenase